MFSLILKVLGLDPKAPKTGAREAGISLVLVALGLTIWAIIGGIEMVQALTPVLLAVWGSACGLFGYAFKLKSDRIKGGSEGEGG